MQNKPLNEKNCCKKKSCSILIYYEVHKIFELGISRLSLGIIFSFILMFTISGLSLPAEANSTDENMELDEYEWTVLAGEGLLNDPTAVQILKNIEISKQRIAQLEDPQIQKTEHEKFVDQQREMAKLRLDEELERIYKKYEDHTPRAAFAKFVDKKPDKYHDFYWELFNYMEQKVIVARQARDQILENGGTRSQAQETFIALAKMPKAERLQFVNEMNVKYGFLNKMSSNEDFNKLPIETRNAYAKYIDNNKPSSSVIIRSSETVSPTDTSTSMELVSFTSPFVVEESGDKFSNDEKNQVTKILSPTSMSFSGNGYTSKIIDSMDEVSQFTLSAWVKPDFSKGSTELTILSKEDAFSLTITNHISPEHIVRFSVFDGIKWTMLESSSTVHEKWTHVAVTLDGVSLSLFIDGKLESTKQIQGIPGMNSYGFVSLQEVENISSEKTILIGAQESTKRGELKQKGFFSGQIDEVIIEADLFDEQKIQELCQKSQYYSA